MAASNDRSCDKLREERHIDGEIQKRVRQGIAVTIDVYRVAQRLKRVERNAHGQNDLRDPIRVRGGTRHKKPQFRQQEVRVFEKGQYAQVAYTAQRQPRDADPFDVTGRNSLTRPIIQQRREDQEQYVGRIPGHIKNIA